MKGSLHCEAVDGQANAGRSDQLTQRRDIQAWAVTLAVLVLCLCAAIAGAQTVPNVVVSEVTTLAATGGGALAGTNPAGSSMAVDSAGNLYVSTTYGGTIMEFSPDRRRRRPWGNFPIRAALRSIRPAISISDRLTARRLSRFLW